MRRAIAATGFAALIAMVVGASPASAGGGPVPNFDHVFLIMMENTGFDSLIGNSNAPFINETAANNGLALNYFGITHPSQPNYIGATSGSLNGVTSDADVNVSATNIVDQVEGSGRTWKAYMQSLSLCATKLDHACGNQLYERKHNPFVSYTDVQSNSGRMANIVDFGQFSSDLASGDVANYVWISPDQCHDMHGRFSPTPDTDPCAFQHVPGLISTGDSFLASTVSAITSSTTWKTSNSVIFITWDESDFTGSGFQGFGDDRGCCDSPAGAGGGHVVTLVMSSTNPDMRRSGVAFNHYSMLSTIQHAWGLNCLGFTCDSPAVRPMISLTGGDV
ncbi:MAG TPA: alkaline phosphatase family protein [Candidatus Dormibacteraeota bacterium]|nr:alkaline phosphatase family protein [Candidatus Dormibacteraeota bacterium]